jgi:MFS family permease
VVIGIAFAILMVAYATLLQRRTPDELQGRVFAATEMVVTIPYAASIGIGAWLVSFVDVRVLYVLSAIGLLAAGAALLVWRIPEPVELPTADEVEGAKEEGATMPQGIVPPA